MKNYGTLHTVYLWFRCNLVYFSWFAVLVLPVVVSGQPTNLITNQVWNNMPDLAPVPDTWVYPFSPATYFWAGGAAAFAAGGFCYVCRLIRSVSQSGDTGGSE